MNEVRVTIPGTFATLNEFIEASKHGSGWYSKGKKDGKRWNGGNSMKQRDQRTIMCHLPHLKLKPPVSLHYTFYEKNKRRDQDNISGYFHKIFQDSLVCAGMLPGDGWRYVDGMEDRFEVDQKTPRIEVIIRHEKQRR